MSRKFGVLAATVVGATWFSGVAIPVAHAGTYPKESTYDSGGSGDRVDPQQTPSRLDKSFFAPENPATPGCGTVTWDGGCG